MKSSTEADLNPVSYLAQVENAGRQRAAFVNVSDTLLDHDWLQQMFEQSGVDRIMDGLLEIEGEEIRWTIRFHEKDREEPVSVREEAFAKGKLFDKLYEAISDLATQAGVTLPERLSRENFDYGTESADSFLKFLEGYDALSYIQQSNGAVVEEFSPEPAMEALLESCRLDPEFLGPYETLVQLCRACGHFQIGTFAVIEGTLQKLHEMAPDDFRATFAMGELYQFANDVGKAAELYEKAISIDPNEASLYTRLGMMQLAQGMPVNAERNFRKAVEMEGDDKPSMDYLAAVLQQTNREHEVPALWKGLLDQNASRPQIHAKYAIALYQAGREQDGLDAFENALTSLESDEDKAVIKRYFAPILAQRGDLDRAMDFYEDCIDYTPNDVPLLLEYAQTLQQADRSFEIPQVLRNVLGSNPDPNTRAQTMAWLIELEQPKRTDVVETAREKMENGDFEAAIRDLKPLRNWLADYWKMWALLSSAHNRLGQSEEAEDAAKRLLEIFPGCEPAYGELVTALNSQGKDEEAYHTMRIAAMSMPQSFGVHVNLALAAKRAGHDDEARMLAKQLREAVGPNEELEPIFAEIER